MSIQTISPNELNELIRSGSSIELLDVRTPVEFREMHVECAKNMPLDQLDPAQIRQAHSDAKPLHADRQNAMEPSTFGIGISAITS